MKKIGILLTITCLLGCEKQDQMIKEAFKAERVSRTASFTVNENIEVVFPLFGAFEERKWEPGWKPVLIYPDQEIIEEGTAFSIDVRGHGDDSESEYLWIVSKYEPQSYLIQYLVSTPNRFWTITVSCKRLVEMKTSATVTYSFTGLNAKGNELNKRALEKMYTHNLQDWADALHTYLATQS